MKRKMHLTKTLSMAKWILCMLVVGGLTFTTYSCKDYDDDIDNLQGQINTIKTAIETLEGKINTGLSITSVTPIENGIRVTLSDGTPYNITNGTNGTNGTDGVGSVWTIGSDGFWYNNGVKTDNKAIGEKGDKGDQGEKGDAGTGGAGGDVYVPNADGFWYKNGVKTDTKWRVDGTITAVVEDGVVKLYGVPGYADGYALSMNTGDLKALVLETDAVVEGYPAIEFLRLTYRPLTATGAFANASVAVVNEISNTPLATYHMNPSSVTAAMIQTDNLAFNWKGAKILSRSASTEPTAEFVEIKDGRLVVKVLAKSENIYTSPIDSLDLVALQVPLAGDGAPVITSDYAALHASIYDKFEIAHAGKTKNSYTTNRPIDGEYFYHSTATLGVAFTDADYLNAVPDTAMVWNNANGINLAGLVKLSTFDNTWAQFGSDLVYENHGSEIDTEAFGLTYKFEVVSTTLGQSGAGATNQKDFVKLTGTNLTVDVYGQGATTAAIGRTPIIKVSLMHGSQVVKVSFIKIEIVGSAAPQPTGIEFDAGTLTVACGTPTPYGVTVQQMNLLVYSALGLSKEQFHSQYTFDTSSPVITNVGTVTAADPSTGATESTEVLTWQLTSADLWTNIGKEITYIAKYTGPSTVSIKLKARVTGLVPVINYSTSAAPVNNVFTPFWDANAANFKQNVKVPAVGETAYANCSFSNVIYSGFVTYQGALATGQRLGWIDFSKATDYTSFKSVYDNMVVHYKFAKENIRRTSFGNVTNVNVTLSADSLTLFVDGVEALKIVPNTTDATLPAENIIIQVVEDGSTTTGVSEKVKALISSDEFYAIIKTEGFACADPNNVVKIGGNRSIFNAKFVTPVKAETKNGGVFVDAVSGGSRVNIYSLLTLTDWRNSVLVSYNSTTGVATKNNLYDYYGVEAIEINTAKSATISDGINTFVVNPANITIDALTDEVIYKNEGSPISINHTLVIPVKVSHKWGVVEIDLTATVKPAGN